MNYLPWPRPWRLVRPLASSALCLAISATWAQAAPPAKAAGDSPFTMTQALEAAWQRSVDQAESQGRLSRARAEQAVAQSWLAAPAAVSASQREGRSGSPSGARETELGVALPLWRPGQRTASGEASEAEAAWAQSAEQAAKLRLAGALREIAGALSLAQAEANQAERQTDILLKLASDVERRVKAGDLAPADLLAARAELLTSQAQERAGQQALLTQQSAWRVLTGFEQFPREIEVRISQKELPEAHPELRLVEAAVELAQRRLALAQLQRSASPELSIGVRQERPGLGSSPQNSVVVGLRLPFGGEVHQQPRIAAALADQEIAQAQARRTRERLAAELELAQSQLTTGQAQSQLEQDRAALLRERAQLIDKSFRAGESPLPELLRALGAAALADTASARQKAAVQLAYARLQQALGNLP